MRIKSKVDFRFYGGEEVSSLVLLIRMGLEILGYIELAFCEQSQLLSHLYRASLEIHFNCISNAI